MLLGSNQDCHFQILLGNVEAVHAKVRWGLEGSPALRRAVRHGHVRERREDRRDHHLSDGDRICLGPPGSKNSCKLLVRIPEGCVPPADEDSDEEPLVLIPARGGLAASEAEALPLSWRQEAPAPVEPPGRRRPRPLGRTPRTRAGGTAATGAARALRARLRHRAAFDRRRGPRRGPAAFKRPRTARRPAGARQAQRAEAGSVAHADLCSWSPWLLAAVGAFFGSEPPAQPAGRRVGIAARSEPGQVDHAQPARVSTRTPASNLVRFGDQLVGRRSPASADQSSRSRFPPDLPIPAGATPRSWWSRAGKKSKPVRVQGLSRASRHRPRARRGHAG